MEGKIGAEPMVIMAYNKKEVKKFFNFKKNGFEFGTCSNQMKKELEPYLKLKSAVDHTALMKALKPQLEAWADAQGIEYDHVIVLGGVYRDEEAGTTFPLVHIDFDKADTSKFMKDLRFLWKNNVQLGLNLSKLSDADYANINIVQMVNVWMPLNKTPTENTLGVMDNSRLNPKDLIPVRSKSHFLSFPSILTHSSKTQQFIIQTDIKFGDMIYFDTLNTPHAGVIVPRKGASKEKRQSVELRAIIVKNK